MAIYRPRRARWPLFVASVLGGLVVGFAIGALAFGGRPADLEDAARLLRGELADAAGLLEVAAVEYREAVPGDSIESTPEYEGARDAVATARGRFDAVADALAAIDGERVAAISAGFDELERLMAEPASADEVEAAIGALDALLSASG